MIILQTWLSLSFLNLRVELYASKRALAKKFVLILNCTQVIKLIKQNIVAQTLISFEPIKIKNFNTHHTALLLHL